MKQMSHRIGWLLFTLAWMVGITNALTFSLVQVRTLTSSRLWYRGDDDNVHDNQDVSSSWKLKEDWALLDQLDKFTVGEGEHVRTFWTQLAASTPILSSKLPHALWERCQQLDHQHQDQQHHNNRTFGPSPPLLTNWRLEGNRAVGTLGDGRVVWMQYHVVGRQPGDLFSDATSPSLMALIPGGYLEAFGGRIYELGQPAREMTKTHTSSPLRVVEEDNNWQDEQVVKPKSEEHQTIMTWWLPATTGTISAMLASTVLSACIGYGAGLGIIADESGPHHKTIMVQPTPQEQYYQLHYKTSPSYSTPSMEERKAHVANRIKIEEGLLDSISEQLQKDQADLQGLERLQFYEQQARADNLLP